MEHNTPEEMNSEPEKFVRLLKSQLAQQIVGGTAYEITGAASDKDWAKNLCQQISVVLEGSLDAAATSIEILSLGREALQAFLQATVSGPPLSWDPIDVLFPSGLLTRYGTGKDQVHQQLRAALSVDGEAVYRLLPCVELFLFSKILLNHSQLDPTSDLLRWRLRVNTWHQRLLSDLSPTLQECIYRDLQLLEDVEEADYLIERASVHTLHGLDKKTRADLRSATSKRHFVYALTGHLGKRTKFQERELSQLVVLAKSTDSADTTEQPEQTDSRNAPKAIELNDDTLLESIAFSKVDEPITDVVSDEDLPEPLVTLNPSMQPLLHPLDSIILLSIASLIIDTSPQDGLTREETLPYAERVLNGGSSNWQVYTQALLIRSRIEGYKSRTAERGVLQLQALVDQVIAETTASVDAQTSSGLQISNGETYTFLPRSMAAESAPAADRLKYIHQLGSPPRWRLEAELADRWVSLGGLRTALEIYERLELWAEAALCWAATDREDKARKIVRRQLYDVDTCDNQADNTGDVAAEDYFHEKDSLPNDAPRLFCILGDLEKSADAYERAWEVSNHRYARAQRSLGRLYLASGEVNQAGEAYEKSLKVNPQNHATWFALGCIRLQLESWVPAGDAFSRAVQIDDTDAESWSNLAVALLKDSESIDSGTAPAETTRRIKESFVALKRAAALKRDSFRIWQNLLGVAIKLEPPPYIDIVITQTRLIELLGATEGEKCIDVPVMEALLVDTVRLSGDRSSSENLVDGSSPRIGLEKMVVDLIQKKITPLITSSRRLWILTAKLAIYLQRPHAALVAYEKAWRSQTNQPGWDSAMTAASKRQWQEVADSTTDLIDAYESLGGRPREAGMGEGELVAIDWKFKSRSAAKSVLARAKEGWEDDEAFGKIQQRLTELKTG